MEIAKEWFGIFGLVIILTGSAFVFVQSISIITKRSLHSLRFGFELLVFFGAAYFFANPTLSYLSIDNYSQTIENVFSFLWWISLAFTINQILKKLVWEGVLAFHGERHVPKLLTDGTSILIYILAIGIVLHFVHEESVAGILAASGATAFLVGLAAQSTLKEVFAGIAINTTRSLKIGDFVEIEGIVARIIDINWRSVCAVNPATNSLFIFPNSVVASSTFVNYNEPDSFVKDHIDFTAETQISPDKIIEIVNNELTHCCVALTNPEPDINIIEFNDMGVKYRVRYFRDVSVPPWRPKNEVSMAIWSSLRRNDIRLSIDRHKLQTGNEYEDSPWGIEKGADQNNKVEEYLLNLDVFSSLDREKISSTAKSGVFYDYTPPNRINLEEGKIYFVASGKFILKEQQENGSLAEIEILDEGSFFGLEELISSHNTNFLVQCVNYGTICTFNIEPLKDFFQNNEAAGKKLRNELEKRQKNHDQRRIEHTKSQQILDHKKQKNFIKSALRNKINSTFYSSTFRHIFSAILGKDEKNELLKSIMAACALIATCRGPIDSIEREYLRQHLRDVDLLRHISVEFAFSNFENYAMQITNDGQSGLEKAVAQVQLFSDHEKFAPLIIEFAIGMSGVHEKTLDEEVSMIKKIQEVLKVPPAI
jgi:small-conductance mechanosensitive channel/tellurite resistance protein